MALLRRIDFVAGFSQYPNTSQRLLVWCTEFDGLGTTRVTADWALLSLLYCHFLPCLSACCLWYPRGRGDETLLEEPRTFVWIATRWPRCRWWEPYHLFWGWSLCEWSLLSSSSVTDFFSCCHFFLSAWLRTPEREMARAEPNRMCWKAQRQAQALMYVLRWFNKSGSFLSPPHSLLSGGLALN